MAGDIAVLTGLAVIGGLDNYQFELDQYRWGLRMPISTRPDGFDPGTNGFLNQDTQSSITGATMMGRDVRTAQTWAWTLDVSQVDEATALAELAEMGRRFLGGVDGFRTSRDTKMLRYRIADRTRVIFGRPRSFDYKPDNLLMYGRIPPAATFQKADPLHYSDEEFSADTRLGAVSPGGFEWPITWPLTFNLNAEYLPPWKMVVEGDAPTHPIVEFYGPVLNPSVKIGDFTLGMTGRIGDGGIVTIDTRPWAQSVGRTGNTSDANLNASTRLSKAVLKPGAYDAVFSGVDESGTARCRIRWRNAWHTL